jgi:hypothetical protein
MASNVLFIVATGLMAVAIASMALVGVRCMLASMRGCVDSDSSLWSLRRSGGAAQAMERSDTVTGRGRSDRTTRRLYWVGNVSLAVSLFFAVCASI